MASKFDENRLRSPSCVLSTQLLLSVISCVFVLTRAQTDNRTLYYFNQYGADNNNVQDCSFGLTLSHMYVVQFYADTCKKIDLKHFNEQQHMIIEADPDTGKPNLYKFSCDSTCTHCQEAQPIGSETCFENYEGSASVYPYFCAGSSNLDRLDGFSGFIYSSQNCDMEEHNMDHTLYIRNYEKKFTDGCVLDFVTGSTKYYYQLNYSEVNGTTQFQGKMQCTDEDCTTCDYDLTNLVEGDCLAGQGTSFMLERSDKLSNCRSAPGPPPPGSPTPAPDAYGNNDTDDVLIGAVVGGGVGLSLFVFGIALAYRKYEFRNRQAQNVSYASVKNSQYGTANYDEEGMTTDI